MARRATQKVAQQKIEEKMRFWLSLVGILISAAIMLAGLTKAFYTTKTEALAAHQTIKEGLAVEFNLHKDLPAHPIQQQMTKDIKQELMEQDAKIDRIHDNIIRIGERLRVRDLRTGRTDAE